MTLQHSTPIFDDVASAWFKEHEAVPVGWTAPLARGAAGAKPEASARQTPSPNAPLPDAPAADAPAADVTAAEVAPAGGAPADTAPAPVAPSTTVGSPPLARRQPGKTLAGSQSHPTGKPGPSGQPDWGAGDEGWRAAEALAQPVGAEVTGTGLPRRQPRALLVPGAAGAAEPTSASPVRSAESVRGRLASYQQGIREGRQARASLEQDATGTQRDGEEATK